jgi:tripartite-type tricarboxylate transporter receptor subunit TctC
MFKDAAIIGVGRLVYTRRPEAGQTTQTFMRDAVLAARRCEIRQCSTRAIVTSGAPTAYAEPISIGLVKDKSMRHAILLVLLAFSSFLGVSPTAAQNWPERPVTMVVPFAPGGGTDLLGRIVARRLGEVLGQQIVIENVAGAGGMLGSARVVKSPPDGYTMVIGTTADAINQSLYKAPLYNYANDLVPAGLMGSQPTVLLARKDFPANNLQEFAAHVKADPASIKVGSAGVGSTGHLFCELLHNELGIKGVTHVPYRGGGPAMQDLIAGRYDYICTLTPTGKPLIEANSVKGLAILQPKRSPELPNLASSAEQGLPGFDVSTWFGLFFPKGTPEPIVRKLNAALGETLDSPWVNERFKDIVAYAAPRDQRSPEYLKKLVDSEIAKMAAAIRGAGIQQF